MIRHVVFYSYRDDVPDSDIQKIYEDLDTLSARLPGRLSYSWGKYDGYDDGHQHYTHCLIIDFKDEAARHLFMTDPERLAFAQREVATRMNGGKNGALWLDFKWN